MREEQSGGCSACCPRGSGYNLAVTPSGTEFLKPWVEAEAGPAASLLSELLRELSPRHPLSGLALKAVAHSRAADDVLFAMEDGRVVEVHLTHSGRAERIPWPIHRFYANLEEWAEQVMLPERDGD